MSKDAKPVTMAVDGNEEEEDDKGMNKVFSRLLATSLKELERDVWLFASLLYSCCGLLVVIIQMVYFYCPPTNIYDSDKNELRTSNTIE
jgi:hypothetical protein